MKYLITRTECIGENNREVFREPISTNNIEATRKEIHRILNCRKIVFVYRETNQLILKK